ncbi:uncharacterized protein LOC106165622 [Lingula anatina]|uniref:Uncharacterized protein LOC106165622 n=1 Tax=Lingula anatina TaxID=7574 RepID=A0A1S3IMD3_LINAN|nr:uncharacterized protein LOC106165622 [Lingula anatina]|eukprot:XP_013399362.1 uncharacterized protein LOC106165622 [Lingula anatina]
MGNNASVDPAADLAYFDNTQGKVKFPRHYYNNSDYDLVQHTTEDTSSDDSVSIPFNAVLLSADKDTDSSYGSYEMVQTKDAEGDHAEGVTTQDQVPNTIHKSKEPLNDILDSGEYDSLSDLIGTGPNPCSPTRPNTLGLLDISNDFDQYHHRKSHRTEDTTSMIANFSPASLSERNGILGHQEVLTTPLENENETETTEVSQDFELVSLPSVHVSAQSESTVPTHSAKSSITVQTTLTPLSPSTDSEPISPGGTPLRGIRRQRHDSRSKGHVHFNEEIPTDEKDVVAKVDQHTLTVEQPSETSVLASDSWSDLEVLTRPRGGSLRYLSSKSAIDCSQKDTSVKPEVPSFPRNFSVDISDLSSVSGIIDLPESDFFSVEHVGEPSAKSFEEIEKEMEDLKKDMEEMDYSFCQLSGDREEGFLRREPSKPMALALEFLTKFRSRHIRYGSVPLEEREYVEADTKSLSDTTNSPNHAAFQWDNISFKEIDTSALQTVRRLLQESPLNKSNKCSDPESADSAVDEVLEVGQGHAKLVNTGVTFGLNELASDSEHEDSDIDTDFLLHGSSYDADTSRMEGPVSLITPRGHSEIQTDGCSSDSDCEKRDPQKNISDDDENCGERSHRLAGIMNTPWDSNMHDRNRHFSNHGTLPDESTDILSCSPNAKDQEIHTVEQNNDFAESSHGTRWSGPFSSQGKDTLCSEENSTVEQTDDKHHSSMGAVGTSLQDVTNRMDKVSKVNIGAKHDIITYAEQEWKGTTKRADAMKKGYHAIVEQLGFKHMRCVRGDNYCAIRAALYQAIIHKVPILEHIGKLKSLSKALENAAVETHPYIAKKWTFAHRLPHVKNQDDFLPTMHTCVQTFFKQVEESQNGATELERESKLLKILNDDEDCFSDICMMEAVKILMMLKAIQLYGDYQNGGGVPTFVWLMFARDTSETPEAFLTNHLNCVGDSAGLEQIEMFLLAHTLGVTIQVARPSKHGAEDFITYYPDDMRDQFPTVTVIAEDDRHYNVALS